MVKLNEKKNNELGEKTSKIMDKTIKALEKVGEEYNVEIVNCTIIKNNKGEWTKYTFSI